MPWTCPLCEGGFGFAFSLRPWCAECDRIPLWRAASRAGEALPSPPPLEEVAFRYWLGGITYRKLLLWKNRPSRALRKLLFRWEPGELARLRAFRADAVTWIPQSPSRTLALGRSPARECALLLASSLGVPGWDLLLRDPSPDPRRQAGLDRREREERVLPYRVRKEALRASRARRVILVDDFLTTGHTLAAGGRVLMDAGVSTLQGWCLGRKPPRGTRFPQA